MGGLDGAPKAAPFQGQSLGKQTISHVIGKPLTSIKSQQQSSQSDDHYDQGDVLGAESA